MKIKDIGEFGLIDYLRKNFAYQKNYIGIGDDCAFIPPDVVITSDMMVEKVHFDFSYLKPRSIGHRAAAACLSDLAACGARPVGILVSIVLKKNLDIKVFKQLYTGINTVIKKFSTQLLGGDISQGNKIVLSFFGIGKTKRLIKRSGAKPGDFVYISGHTGLAEAGRLVLKKRLPESKYQKSISRHTKPMPRIKLGMNLNKKVSSMIDISDGLLIDTNHIAEESEVGIEVDNIPIHAELKKLGKAINIPVESLALSGGEDFELLFTSPRKLKGFHKIGRVIKGKGIRYKGKKIKPKGYQHFRSTGIN